MRDNRQRDERLGTFPHVKLHNPQILKLSNPELRFRSKKYFLN